MDSSSAPISTSPSLNALWGALLIEELVRNGTGLFCICPGSRSAPLALAVAAHPRAEDVVHFDERGAAYYAVGYAKATGRPAALICTSGTAAANYFPAVIEASQACAPLVVLTADRPPELRDAGANQAIDQTKIFGGYVRWQIDLPCPDEKIPPEMVLTTISQAVYRATRAPAGPVHVNCMFREPLAPIADGCDLRAYRGSISAWAAGGKPYTTYCAPESTATAGDLQEVARHICGTTRGLLIAGQLSSLAETEAVRRLSSALNWPVFPDVASGLRLGSPNPPFIHYYDQLLLAPGFRQYCTPETVIQIGAPFTSKRLLQLFEQHPPKNYIMAANHPMRHDPAHRVTLRIEAAIAPFCDALAASKTADDRAAPRTPWLQRFARDAAIADTAIREALSRHEGLSEPAVARIISENIPEGGALFLGNSLPIRDMDRYGASGGAPVRAGVNRGASGIDGTLASAVGYARGAGVPVTVLLGDMALLHDLNTLVLLAQSALPVTAVLVNNKSGGIFSFLPVAEHASGRLDRYFLARHNLPFHAGAEFARLKFAHPDSDASFTKAYRECVAARRPALIEADSDPAENVRFHHHIEAAIVSALENPGQNSGVAAP